MSGQPKLNLVTDQDRGNASELVGVTEFMACASISQSPSATCHTAQLQATQLAQLHAAQQTAQLAWLNQWHMQPKISYFPPVARRLAVTSLSPPYFPPVGDVLQLPPPSYISPPIQLV